MPDPFDDDLLPLLPDIDDLLGPEDDLLGPEDDPPGVEDDRLGVEDDRLGPEEPEESGEPAGASAAGDTPGPGTSLIVTAPGPAPPSLESPDDGVEETEESLAALVPASEGLAPESAPRRRRYWTRRPDRPLPAGIEPGDVVLDFHKVFATFQVDWTRGRYNVLGQRCRRSALLNWHPNDLKTVEETSEIYKKGPRICPGMERDINVRAGESEETPVEARTGPPLCLCARRYHADTREWADHPCPADVVMAFRQMGLYANDLEIQPYEHTDVMQMTEIIKLHLYEAQCDDALQQDGKIHDSVLGALDQRTGVPYWNKKTPAALETQAGLSRRRITLYEKLVASRDAKEKKRLAEGKLQIQAGQTGAILMSAAESFAQVAKNAILDKRTRQAELGLTPELGPAPELAPAPETSLLLPAPDPEP